MFVDLCAVVSAFSLAPDLMSFFFVLNSFSFLVKNYRKLKKTFRNAKKSIVFTVLLKKKCSKPLLFTIDFTIFNLILYPHARFKLGNVEDLNIIKCVYEHVTTTLIFCFWFFFLNEPTEFMQF